MKLELVLGNLHVSLQDGLVRVQCTDQWLTPEDGALLLRVLGAITSGGAPDALLGLAAVPPRPPAIRLGTGEPSLAIDTAPARVQSAALSAQTPAVATVRSSRVAVRNEAATTQGEPQAGQVGATPAIAVLAPSAATVTSAPSRSGGRPSSAPVAIQSPLPAVSADPVGTLPSVQSAGGSTTNAGGGELSRPDTKQPSATRSAPVPGVMPGRPSQTFVAAVGAAAGGAVGGGTPGGPVTPSAQGRAALESLPSAPSSLRSVVKTADSLTPASEAGQDAPPVRRGPGRPPGSGKKAVVAVVTQAATVADDAPPVRRGPGRPPGSGKKADVAVVTPPATVASDTPPVRRGPGRPPGSGKKAVVAVVTPAVTVASDAPPVRRGPGRPPGSGKKVAATAAVAEPVLAVARRDEIAPAPSDLGPTPKRADGYSSVAAADLGTDAAKGRGQVRLVDRIDKWMRDNPGPKSREQLLDVSVANGWVSGGDAGRIFAMCMNRERALFTRMPDGNTEIYLRRAELAPPTTPGKVVRRPAK